MAKSGFNSSLEQSLFDHYTVQELAEGITFVMFRVYGSIGPSELHDGSWQVLFLYYLIDIVDRAFLLTFFVCVIL